MLRSTLLQRFLPVLFALFVPLTFAAGVRADELAPSGVEAEGAPAPLQESLPPEARREYDAARVLFEDRDFSGSIAKFKRAYQLSGDPRLLWNQAVCEKELRQYARASELIRRYLSEGRDLIESSKREDAERILASLKQFSSRVVVSGAPSGSKLSVDGELVGIMPLKEPLVVDLGSHRLEVSYPGYRSWSRVVDVPGAAPVSVFVSLQSAAQLAHLSIRSLPQASIVIDGTFAAEGRYEGSLSPGSHSIVVSASGRKTEKRTVQLQPSSHQTMEITLKERSANRAIPWVLGGAVLVGGAVATAFSLAQSGGFEGPTGSLGSIDAR